MASSSKNPPPSSGSPMQVDAPPSQPIYYSTRAKTVPIEGICTSFKPKGFLDQGQSVETVLHDAFAKGIRVYEIVGAGENQYLAWQLADPTSSKAVKELFTGFLTEPQKEWFMNNINNLIRSRANNVIVEGSNGAPYEKYMTAMCSHTDHRRRPALLIAFYGRRNASPCECCLKRMGRSFSSTQDGKVPVMVPFFECRSLHGFHNNACANCVYHVEGSECTFNKHSDIREVRKAMAGEWVEFKNMPSSEITIGKTAQLAGLLSFDTVRNEEHSTVRGRRPRPYDADFPPRRPWE